MDEEADPGTLTEILDLEDEIALKEGILESLNQVSGDDEDEEERRSTRKELKKLKKRLHALKRPQKEEKDDEEDPSFDQIPRYEDSLSRNAQDYLRSPQFKLASRKRQRSDFEESANRRKSSKSRRTSPNPAVTGTTSPARSTASADSLDDSFGSFFGLTKEEIDHEEMFWNDRERKRQQEENDARLAQSLSQEWEAEETAARPSKLTATTPASDVQSFLRPNGMLNRVGTQAPSRPIFPATEPTRTTIESDPDYSSAMPGAFPTLPMPEAPNPAYVSRASQFVYDLNGTAYASNGNPATPQGYNSPDDERADPAQHEAELRGLLEHIRPDEELTAEEMPPQPHGMKVDLMPHQLSGLKWLKSMEDAPSTKGGILADDMGLGKTIQAIALMLEHKPLARDHRPTLVVAPLALLHQWKREIQKMVRPSQRMEVFIMHGETRKVTWTNLKSYDVVLTTYGTLAADLKRKVELDNRVKEHHIQISPGEDCPILGDRSRFHRVILDEAQNIKNRATKAALAACRIDAEYRWCLTGTPMQNNVEEMYSLIKFLRIRPYNSWGRFRVDIAGPLKQKRDTRQERGMATLQALLRVVLLRRTKTSTIHGRSILQLPPKEIREDRVVFDDHQRDFYFAFEKRAKIQMNKYLKEGNIGRHYANALVLLLVSLPFPDSLLICAKLLPDGQFCCFCFPDFRHLYNN
jgi:hypothetical protein